MKYWIVGVAVLLLGALWFAAPRGATQTASVHGGVETENSFDFGTISMAQGKVMHAFSLASSSPVTLTKIFTSCMCTEASLVRGPSTNSGQAKHLGPFGMPGHMAIPAINESIALGEQASLEVVFDPAAHGPAGVGTIERVVTVERADGAPLRFGIKALVTP